MPLQEQTFNDFPTDLTDIFHLLNIDTHFFMLGSSSYKNLLYNADFDVNSVYKSKDTGHVLETLYKHF